ncbi:MAG: agmatinase family protein [Planctomycetota bacterium]
MATPDRDNNQLPQQNAAHEPTHDPGAPISSDTDRLFGLPTPRDEASVIVIPVPFDATCSYRTGAASAPRAVLRASAQLDLLDRRFGPIYTRGIFMDPIPEDIELLNTSTRRLVDRVVADLDQHGTTHQEHRDAIATADTACELVRQHVTDRVRCVLDADQTPLLLGGEHGVSLGAITACAERYPTLGVLQIDAHMDLRRAYMGLRYSHASVMLNTLEDAGSIARVVQVGVRDFAQTELDFASARRITTHFWDDLADQLDAGASWRSLAESMIEPLPREVYVTLDIDGLDPTLCPNTGTPVPGGLSWDQAGIMLEVLNASGRRVIGMDLVEVSPGAHETTAGNDREHVPTSDSVDAIVGARLLYRMCALAAEKG